MLVTGTRSVTVVMAAVAAVAGVALAVAARLMAVPAAPTDAAWLYAAGDVSGFLVIDVRAPRAPVVAGAETKLARVRDVAAGPGTVAYAAADAAGFAVLDVRDPAAPTVSLGLTTRRPAVELATSANRVYAAEEGNPNDPGGAVVIYDASDPLLPEQVGRAVLTVPVLALAATDSSLFIGTATSIQIFDVADPASPSLIGRLPRPADGLLLVDNSWLISVSGRELAVADVSQPDQPKPQEAIDVGPGLAQAVALAADGRHLLVAGMPDTAGAGGGLALVDFTDRAAPRLVGNVAAGLPGVDVVADAQVYLAAGQSGLFVYSFDPPALPEPVGNLQAPVFALAMGPADQQPTPSPTATPTASPTRTDDATATPTARVTPTVTLTPRATQTATRPGDWVRYDDDTGPPGAGRVRYARGAAGRVWLRVQRPAGGPDQVLEVLESRLIVHDSLRQAVQRRYELILQTGTVRDLWSVAPNGHVWTGPEYYDGAVWRRLAEDELPPGGRIVHEERSLVDASGRAWVPFSSEVDCPEPTGCGRLGIRIFDETGLARTIPLEAVPEASEYGIEGVRLIPGASGGGPLAESRPPSAPLQVDEGYVVAHRELFQVPTGDSVPYPFLAEPEGNPGYASAATRRTDGLLQVFTWLEDHASRPELAWRILANTWDGATWDVWDLTAECPLVHGGNEEFLRITAAAYGPDGALWVGSSYGELAIWRAGAWVEHFTPSNSPLADGRPVTDITVTAANSAWVVQPGALLSYGIDGQLETALSIHLPSTERP